VHVAADWVTISALATAGGTLVLAIATFASVRSANRSARVAERSLLAGLRPVLSSSRPDDPVQKVSFLDDRWFRIPGGQGIAEVTDTAIYLAMSVRNVGAGMAVLRGWNVHLGDRREIATSVNHRSEDFRVLTRDLYIPPGEPGFWQGAYRDPSEPEFAEVAEEIDRHVPFVVELLYSDHEGGQRVITMFTMAPHKSDDTGEWVYLTSTSRHWNLDRNDPR
jgi:hypothetical protein